MRRNFSSAVSFQFKSSYTHKTSLWNFMLITSHHIPPDQNILWQSLFPPNNTSLSNVFSDMKIMFQGLLYCIRTTKKYTNPNRMIHWIFLYLCVTKWQYLPISKHAPFQYIIQPTAVLSSKKTIQHNIFLTTSTTIYLKIISNFIPTPLKKSLIHWQFHCPW